MILTGKKIIEEVRGGKIDISPFDEAKVTTNSYDLLLGKTIVRYTCDFIDPAQEPSYELIEIPKSGLVLEAGDFVLGSSVERIGSDHYVPIIHGKSGTARMGLFVHVTADLIDIGWHGNSTFQLYAALPLKIYPNIPIAQVSFWVPYGDIKLYEGKYQDSKGPQPTLVHRDYKYRLFRPEN